MDYSAKACLLDSPPKMSSRTKFYRCVIGMIFVILLIILYKQNKTPSIQAVDENPEDNDLTKIKWFREENEIQAMNIPDGNEEIDIIPEQGSEVELHQLDGRLSEQFTDKLGGKEFMMQSKKNTDHLKYLLADAIPNVVHYFWCGKYWFEFIHYISILSVIQKVRPDKIYFHYENLPVRDRRNYNQWFEWLLHDYQFFELIEMSDEEKPWCKYNSSPFVDYVMKSLSDKGGMYIGHQTIFLDFSTDVRTQNIVDGLSRDGIEGYMLLRGGLVNKMNLTRYSEALKSKSIVGNEHKYCCTIEEYLEESNRCQECVIVETKTYKTVKPMHIWTSDDRYGRFIRNIFYGTENMLKPEPSFDELVSALE